MSEKKLTMLMILDGFGVNEKDEGNAVNIGNGTDVKVTIEK